MTERGKPQGGRPDARETFRQFAWNLAGKLAEDRRGRPAQRGPGGKR